MGGSKTPKAPKPPKLPPPPPSEVDPRVLEARLRERRRARAAGTRAGTILTTPRGIVRESTERVPSLLTDRSL